MEDSIKYIVVGQITLVHILTTYISEKIVFSQSVSSLILVITTQRLVWKWEWLMPESVDW
jgi:hypothetical protein